MTLSNSALPIELLQYLLPNSDDLHLGGWDFDPINRQVDLSVDSTQVVAPCPVCQTLSHRIHSHYERNLRDLRWADYTVTLHLHVRKFFCTNSTCKRRIFTERLPNVTQPWSRRTGRLAQQLSAIALALGGAAGVRLSRQLGYWVSRNTLLRLIAQLPLPPIEVPQTLGVDDFAFRKRQRYGTILVDLDQHRPIALLADRQAETLAEWLQQHPGVQVLSRDRSKEYKRGMTQGAPAAIQVADRFHLLQNLVAVVEQVFNAHGADLKAVETAHRLACAGESAATVVVAATTANATQSAQQQTQQRRNQRFAIYEQIWKLHRQGWSAPAIAKRVGISARTVQRHLSCPTFPERKPRSDQGRSLLNPYKDYLLKRWNEQVYEAKRLFREIQQQGYGGSYLTVTRYVRQLCQAQGWQPRQRPVGRTLSRVADPKQPPLSARRAAWLLLRRDENRQCEDEQLITRLVEQHPTLALAIELTQSFAHLVRQRLPEQFDLWLERAMHSQIAPLQRFAQGLREDYSAVKAGVTLAVSNGQVEGQVNRLKMLKRQMYGRAGPELLRRRFLLAS